MERKSKNLELFIIDNDNLSLDIQAFEEIKNDIFIEFIDYDIDKELLSIDFELHIYYREKDINSFDFKEYHKVFPFHKELTAYMPGNTWNSLLLPDSTMSLLKQLLIDYASDFVVQQINSILVDMFYITKIILLERG